MKIAVVTTFSKAGYELYGKRFLDTFQLFWPEDVTLYVYTDGIRSYTSDWFVWRDLDADQDRKVFIARNGSDPEKISNRMHPNRQSIRFCHKVFAVTADVPDVDWWIWLDADVETVKKVPRGTLHSWLPEGRLLSYLDRARSFIPSLRYSECGFVGYRVSEPRVRAMLAEMRRIYVSDELFTLGLDHWHDSYVFDLCRQKFTEPGEWYDLAAGADARKYDICHPWEHSPLQECLRHYKGETRKVRAYGGALP